MVIIKEIEINNCYSIENLFLHFEDQNFVTIINCPISHKLKDKLITAIQPFFTKKKSNTHFECNPGVFGKLSSVRVKFIIPKGKFKKDICVDASMVAQKPDYIYYYFDNEQYIETIPVFHEQCQIDVTSLFPCINQVFLNEKKNLMSIWIENNCPSLRSNREKSYELFANYLQLCHLRSENENRGIAKIRNSILTINRHTDMLQKQTFINVANKIGEVFNKLTFSKYAVQFHIPLRGQNLRLGEIQLGDIDFLSTETYIENVRSKKSMLWNTMEPGIKFLLKIAQIIVLAKNLGQQCIIVTDTTILQSYQNEEMVKEAIIAESATDSEANCENKNFLNQIVNICNEMEIMLIMNYNSGFSLPPRSANIIKCTDVAKFPDQQVLYVSEQSEPMESGDLWQVLRQAS